MAIKTISELPLALLSRIDDTMVFAVDDADQETRKLTFAQLRTALGAIAFTGMVTGTGDPFGVITLTVEAGVITRAMMADMPGERLLGRAANTTGAVQEIALGPGLRFNAGVLDTQAAQAASDAAPLYDHRAFGGF